MFVLRVTFNTRLSAAVFRGVNKEFVYDSYEEALADWNFCRTAEYVEYSCITAEHAELRSEDQCATS